MSLETDDTKQKTFIGFQAGGVGQTVRFKQVKGSGGLHTENNILIYISPFGGQ